MAALRPDTYALKRMCFDVDDAFKSVVHGLVAYSFWWCVVVSV